MLNEWVSKFKSLIQCWVFFNFTNNYEVHFFFSAFFVSIFLFWRKASKHLWIVGENLKLDLGCYGAKNVKTPNLDKLAREGERYTKVFSTSQSVLRAEVPFLWVCTRLQRIPTTCVRIVRTIIVYPREFVRLHTV